MEETARINSVITKANGRDVVIDFRDGLVLATNEDFANIHGKGGSKHARLSLIKVTICDFSKGTGDNSVTVSAHISPQTAALLRAVSEKFAVNQPGKISNNPDTNDIAVPAEAADMVSAAYRQMIDAHKKGGKLEGDEFNNMGSQLKAIYNIFKNAITSPKESHAPSGIDWEYSQERVNSYRQGKDGLAADYAPVNKLSFIHSSYKNGEVARYPWTVKIINGSARIKKTGNGSTTYDGSTFTVKREAMIFLSNYDMFSMMTDVSRFIRTWEECYGIPLVNTGEEALVEQRDNIE